MRRFAYYCWNRYCLSNCREHDRSYFSPGQRSGTTVDGRRWTEDGQPRKHSGLKALLHELLRIDIYRHDDLFGECQFVQNPANRFAETADCVGSHEYLVPIVAL